jgi:molybdopterin synthase catalytic subunit
MHKMETRSKQSQQHAIQLVAGPIDAARITSAIVTGQSHMNTGACNIFLGQVRNDVKEGKLVCSIEYSCFEAMALESLESICSEAIREFGLNYVQVVHSMGMVEAGGICLAVIVHSGHRNESFVACRKIVEQIKAKVPIWGKELYGDDSHSWKVNTL